MQQMNKADDVLPCLLEALYFFFFFLGGGGGGGDGSEEHFFLWRIIFKLDYFGVILVSF